jgi:diguanylate cyclase (GGDEF)-like protein/PAS domain S-box-containing protein
MDDVPAVVLVEDSEPYAVLVAHLLRDALPGGVDVRRHGTLAAALADLRERPADCVLLDLGLPDAVGLEGLATLRAAGVEASIVVLSAHEDDELELAAIAAGAQDFLHKGDERDRRGFGRAIRHAIARRRAQERSEDLLRAKEDRWRTVTHLAPVGIFETDAAGRCFFANERFCEIAGRRGPELLGHGWLDALHPEDRAGFDAAWQAAADGDGELSAEVRFARPDGSTVWVIATSVVVRDPWGGPAGWIGTIVDVTETRRAQGELRAAEERLRKSFDHAPIGMAVAGADGRLVEVNRSLCRMLGRPESELVGEPFDVATHPEDRDVSRAEVAALLAGERDAAQWEQRYVRRDDEVVWTRVSVSLLRDPGGRPRTFIAQVEDVTERRAAEQELRRQQQDVVAVAAMAREAGVDEDPCRALCAGARKLLGADFAAVLVHDGDGALEVVAHDGAALGSGASVRVDGEPSGAAAAFLARERVEVEDARGDAAASARLAEAVGARGVVFEPIVRGADALGVLAIGWRRVVGRLGTRHATATRMLAAELAAAIERRRLLDQLRDLARTDALTGLANRRAWDDRLAVEIARATRYERPLCVAMADLDRFKAYNDRHGHQAGDRLLRETTAGWQGVLRGTDLLARLGGDEFALLLPDCEVGAAQAILQRLQGATHAEVGCSAGLALLRDGDDAAALLARADEALYAAKAAGRGGVVVG